MHAGHLLGRRARLTPEREALVDLASGKRQTYAELDERARRAAHVLRHGFGVGAGDRVAVLAPNCAAFVELFYAVGKIGAVLVPLNWRLPASELVFPLVDSEPKVLAVGPELAGVAAEVGAHVRLPPLLALEGADIDGRAYEAELRRASATEPDAPPIAAEDPYCILYTSGTTGRPKGAVIPHRQVLWNCINTVGSWGLSEHDVSPVFTPMFHAGGLFAFLTPLHYLGGRIVLARRFDGAEDLRVIERERCTVILGVPTIYRMWRETDAYREVDLSHVHFFATGGAPCPPSLMHAWREEKDIVFRQGYGLTEVGPNCFAMTDEESARKTGAVGKPVLHGEAALIGNGEVGELALSGPHVCTGYWRNPEATAEVLRDGWFHTGDLARRDEDGFYYIVGRAKDMIISGGENIYAAEVEAAFADHPAVAEAALVGEPHPRWGEVGLLVVIPRPGHRPEADELLRSCEGRLARYKIPKRVVFVDDFPRTALGKPKKAELSRLHAAPAH